MKLVKTNQDLIVGRRYLCRTKPIKVQNGSFTKPEISILHVGEDQGRRYVGPNKFWAYDEGDKIISYKGSQRISNMSTLLKIPFQNVEVIEEDYEVNSQALPRWDMIGPLPEIKEGILHNLFDYPALLKAFENPISVHPDGSVAVYIPEGIENYSDDGWYLINDPDSARELNAELEAGEGPIALDLSGMVEPPKTWDEVQKESDIPKEWSPEQAICLYCNRELIFNVPRLGPDGGYVHKDTGKLECSIKEVELPMTQSAMNNKPQFQKDMLPKSAFIRYTPTEMIGKYVRLTENKYTDLGYFPKGTILKCIGYNLKNFTFEEECSNIHITIDGDGFEFINTEQYGFTNDPNAYNKQPQAGLFSNGQQPNVNLQMQMVFNHLDQHLQICIHNYIRREQVPTMGMNLQFASISKIEKIMVIQQFLNYLQSKP